MPLQNRVNPFGDIVAADARGTFTGNRGVIHNAERKIVRAFSATAWIICVLKFKDHHRIPMSPNTWTELFFLDEATALAAGHRPCAYCQRARYNEYKAAFAAAHGRPHSAKQMDQRLHADRLMTVTGQRRKQKRTYSAEISALPDNTMVIHDNRPHLLRDRGLHPWSFSGYEQPIAISADSTVTVLTPRATVGALSAGYRPTPFSATI